MSLNQLIEDKLKPWLGIRVSFLEVDNEITCNSIDTQTVSLSSSVVNTAGNIDPTKSVNYIDTTSGVLAMTLPNTGSTRVVKLINVGASNNFTIAGSELGGTLSYVVPPGESVSVLYRLASTTWYVVAESGGTTSS